MRAQRYRLRFVSGVSFTAATYGSSTFGGPITYGQRGTDPVNDYRYRIVPLPAGYIAQPAWVRRAGDATPPFEAVITAGDVPLDLSSVSTARLVLTTADGRDPASFYLLDLDVATPTTRGVVVHDWSTTDDVPAGTYRVLVVLVTQSGRRLSLPTNDDLQLEVAPTYQTV